MPIYQSQIQKLPNKFKSKILNKSQIQLKIMYLSQNKYKISYKNKKILLPNLNTKK